MGLEWIVCGAIFIFAVGYAIGLGYGISAERQAWLCRAVNKANPYGSPHHCEGEFYYIIEEEHFCEEYVIGKHFSEKGRDPGGR